MDFPTDEFPDGTVVAVKDPDTELEFIGKVKGWHRVWGTSTFVIVEFIISTHEKTLEIYKRYKYSCIAVKYQSALHDTDSSSTTFHVNIKKLESM